MDRKSLTAVSVLGAALILGIVTDLLLTETAWGVNVFFWSVSALAVIHVGMRSRDKRGLAPFWSLALLILVFAALFAWRDSLTLKVLDGLALFTLVALLAAKVRYEWSPWQPFGEYAARLGHVLFSGFKGAAPIIEKEVDWKQLAQGDSASTFKSVGRGLLLALPILALFTFLLASADARFDWLLTNSIHFDAGSMVTHLAVILVSSWVAAGYLRDVSQKDSVSVTIWRYPFALGIVEVGIVLGLLDLLFAAFVTLQIPYLFGGAGHVIGRAEITYAEYARRGFFELVWVSALVLLLLLHSHSMLRSAGRGGEKLFRALAGLMIALLFVIMASAMQRMRLYEEQYGLTELRFYTTVFMGWLAIVFVWFIPTVLGGLRNRFSFGALIAAMALVLALHFINPDAYIVRTNVARAAEGKPFDARYVSSLSLDSVPELSSALPKLSPSDRKIAMKGLARHSRSLDVDWRGWSWSRSRAAAAMEGLNLTEPPALELPLPPLSPIIPIPFTDADRKRFQFMPQFEIVGPPMTGPIGPAPQNSLPARKGIE